MMSSGVQVHFSLDSPVAASNYECGWKNNKIDMKLSTFQTPSTPKYNFIDIKLNQPFQYFEPNAYIVLKYICIEWNYIQTMTYPNTIVIYQCR